MLEVLTLVDHPTTTWGELLQHGWQDNPEAFLPVRGYWMYAYVLVLTRLVCQCREQIYEQIYDYIYREQIYDYRAFDWTLS